MTSVEKLIKARELILDAEKQLIDETGFCPYEIGTALVKIDEAINQLSGDLS
ncbi:MAG: hypothetical protein ACD_20C00338G0002 [uncultured bacterium]|nr:MAG: hypothetical protein ACD_20C00338G0002 [uncultured bacterium]